jgi:hypothetical protein
MSWASGLQINRTTHTSRAQQVAITISFIAAGQTAIRIFTMRLSCDSGRPSFSALE